MIRGRRANNGSLDLCLFSMATPPPREVAIRSERVSGQGEGIAPSRGDGASPVGATTPVNPTDKGAAESRIPVKSWTIGQLLPFRSPAGKERKE